MSGHPDFNRPAFEEARLTLEERATDKMSAQVVIPHDLWGERDPKTTSWASFLETSIAFIQSKAPVLRVLPGWENSVGTCLEIITGRALTIEFDYSMKRCVSPDLLSALTALERLIKRGSLPPILDGALSAHVEKDSWSDQAHALVHSDRERYYGHPTVNFRRIAQMWSVIFDLDVSTKQVAMAMVATKLAREVNSPKEDNWVDIIGYVMAFERVVKE